MQQIAWFSIMIIVAASSIVSPAFDLDVVQVETGTYHIQSVEPGPQYGKYLSMSTCFRRLVDLVALQFICQVTSNIAKDIGWHYFLVWAFFTTYTFTNIFFTMVLRPYVAILSSYKTRWWLQVHGAETGSFTLQNEAARYLNADPSRDQLGDSIFQNFPSFIAVKAGEDGEVYLKVLMNGARSRWLHPRGRKRVGLRLSKKWKWKLVPNVNL